LRTICFEEIWPILSAAAVASQIRSFPRGPCTCFTSDRALSALADL
jgi:hypothetical protein